MIESLNIKEILGDEEFSQFIQNYTKKLFFRNVSNNTHRFSHLINWGVINQFLSEHRFESSRIMLYKKNEVVDPYYYTQKIEFRNRNVLFLVPEKIDFYIKQGFSIIINSVDEIYQPLTNFVENYEKLFKSRVSVNAYLSFGDIEAFKPHWDDHDVFIFQIYGKKNWHISPGDYPFPLPEDTPNETIPEKFEIQFLSETGDFFYIPRGWWHYATAINEPSLHLTFGITSDTGINFIEWLAKKARDNEFFRKDIPNINNKFIQEEYYATFIKEIKSLLEKDLLSEYLLYKDSIQTARPRFSIPNT